MKGFVKSITGCKISLLAVDESHCISEWGSSFRPDYLKVARFCQEVDAERVLCLTATATQRVAQDICAAFDIDPVEGLFSSSVYRSNLTLQVVPAANDEAKLKILVPFLKRRTGPVIVYVTAQWQAEDTCKRLKDAGIKNVAYYHAGVDNELRKQ